MAKLRLYSKSSGSTLLCVSCWRQTAWDLVLLMGSFGYNSSVKCQSNHWFQSLWNWDGYETKETYWLSSFTILRLPTGKHSRSIAHQIHTNIRPKVIYSNADYKSYAALHWWWEDFEAGDLHYCSVTRNNSQPILKEASLSKCWTIKSSPQK